MMMMARSFHPSLPFPALPPSFLIVPFSICSERKGWGSKRRKEAGEDRAKEGLGKVSR